LTAAISRSGQSVYSSTSEFPYAGGSGEPLDGILAPVTTDASPDLDDALISTTAGNAAIRALSR